VGALRRRGVPSKRGHRKVRSGRGGAAPPDPRTRVAKPRVGWPWRSPRRGPAAISSCFDGVGGWRGGRRGGWGGKNGCRRRRGAGQSAGRCRWQQAPGWERGGRRGGAARARAAAGRFSGGGRGSARRGRAAALAACDGWPVGPHGRAAAWERGPGAGRVARAQRRRWRRSGRGGTRAARGRGRERGRGTVPTAPPGKVGVYGLENQRRACIPADSRVR
jgi:hypothetical protein